MKDVIEILRREGKANSDLELFAKLLLPDLRALSPPAYSTDDLARLARHGFHFLTQKAPRRPKIQVRGEQRDIKEGETGPLTVVEILNDDMPFLVDSVMGEIQERDLKVHLVLHPIIRTLRTDKGRLKTIIGRGDQAWNDSDQESFIQIHLERLDDKSAARLEQALSTILSRVCRVVADWKKMVAHLECAIAEYSRAPPSIAATDLEESLRFLRWLCDGHFIFLGMRDYELDGDSKSGDLKPVPRSGLGLLHDRDVHVLRRGAEKVYMTAEIRKFFFTPDPLIVTKANVFSTIHRRVHMDYVGVKSYRSDGAIGGELRIVGLFTSGAYVQPPCEIPLLRRKVETVLRESDHPPESHSRKALVNVLATFPRDELFQIDVKHLQEWSEDILDLELRPRVRVFSRCDTFDRFVSLLVYIPRDRYTTAVRMRIGDYLADAYQGRIVTVHPFFSEGRMVRVQFIVGRYEGKTPRLSQVALEKDVGRIISTWEDRLETEIRGCNPGAAAPPLLQKYLTAFSAGYADTFSPGRAVQDIERIERLGESRLIEMDVYREDGAPENRVRVSLYQLDSPIPLSERAPVFEDMGFSVIDERSYQIQPDYRGRSRSVCLHDMVLVTADGQSVDLAEHKTRFEDCFLAVWSGQTENDTYNRLIMKAGLDWREAALLRAYGAYLRQIRVPFDQQYLADTLVRHPDLAADLIKLFQVRFDPGSSLHLNQRRRRELTIQRRIEAAFSEIPSLDEDRILRQFLNLFQATTRTNLYMLDTDARPPAVIALKLDSAIVENMPEPRPFAEIFVYSSRLEGIHLRGGPIARGGLRWSDRAQDFRTEVLGLAKAQQVKNAVIVPAGAKGGFVPKRLPEDGTRKDVIREGVTAYRMFVSALLSLTDNLKGGEIVSPERVFRHDGSDPYLVVAADKGTATFSDIANEIARRHMFWLDDAFASGGSAGYDHKKMAITARGAWEAVKRHFREMNTDIQNEEFTVIGIGDMSGDVFGNGMLLSKKIRLIAAFDHRSIFIDPDPDPKKSWTERKRLFKKKRSTWQDYASKVISKGGGVFDRSVKSIKLTPEMQALTGLETVAVTPNGLIRAILKTNADILWFGGIGTYVRASDETDGVVGDRANDAIRITAFELAVKVVGEGANLGITQRARIEFAKRGGRINTDAIDNSAGVNSSDLEVNIKIALGPAVAGRNLSLEGRNALLARMTEEVAAACLRNNYLQTLTISLGEHRGHADDVGFLQRLMRSLETNSALDRELEGLPTDAEISERMSAGEPLTRPELAILLSHSKIELFQNLIESTVPDDPYLDHVLFEYFPEMMRKDYAREIANHRLRREIIATSLANDVINRGGSTMIVRLEEETGCGAVDITYAFVAAKSVFKLDDLWRRIDALDNIVEGSFQLDLYVEVQDLLRRQTTWFLRHVDFSLGLSDLVREYGSGFDMLSKNLEKALTRDQRDQLAERRRRFEAQGVPTGLATELAALVPLAESTDITFTALDLNRPVPEVAPVYFEADDWFRLSELRAAAERLIASDYFDRLAINSALSSAATAHRSVTAATLRGRPGTVESFKDWRKRHETKITRVKANLDDILDGGGVTLSRLTVAASQVRDLVDHQLRHL